MAAQRTAVLVVDDEASIRLLCRVNLELEGYRVFEASSLDEARAALDREQIAVLLIDVHLGDRDGRELVRELRGEERPLGIALLTGTVDLEPHERAGADAVIEKPFRLDELLAVVRRLNGAGDKAARER